MRSQQLDTYAASTPEISWTRRCESLPAKALRGGAARIALSTHLPHLPHLTHRVDGGLCHDESLKPSNYRLILPLS